jgi:DNA-binding NtrC family response regulator
MHPFQDLINKSEETGRARFPVLAGNSVVVHAIRQMVQLGASIRDPLLLSGPAGTGKSAIAHAIHALSAHCDNSFAAFDCSDISPDERQAIFARGSDWPGTHFQGTVFIDEIGFLPADIQSALLDWLSVGNNADRVRLIAATSRPLEELVGTGRFDADLYRSISRMMIPTVPLARRKGDITELIAAIWANDHSALPPNLSNSGKRALQAHDWPGNFPELQRTAHLLAQIYGGRRVAAEQIRRLSGQGVFQKSAGIPVVRPYSLDHRKPPVLDIRAHLEREEAVLIMAALERSGGVICNAARLTGINRATFLQKMRRHGIGRI